MFQLSLVDHIRLSFGSVATSYRSHARAAERLSGRARHSRVVLVTLLSLSTGASLVALSGLRSFQIAAAALSITALAGLAIVYALDFEARAFAHRACAAQLWLLCEEVPRPARRRPRRTHRSARNDSAARPPPARSAERLRARASR